MCIIMYSQSGVGYPTKETLEYCWEKNSDGAGYAFLTTEDTWEVNKGLMDKEEFFAAWEAEEFVPGNTVILHFRIGTSGTWDGACTHPFPIHDEYDELTKLKYNAEHVVFHNGIHGQGENDWSDTMVAIRDYIVPLYPLMEDEKIQNILNIVLKADSSYGSRWIFGMGEDTVLMGKWFTDKDTGIMYSKDDWVRPIQKPSSIWKGWGDDVHPSFRGGVYNPATSKALTVVDRHAQRTRHTDIIYQTGIYASTFEGKDGNWSWKEWTTFKEKEWDEDVIIKDAIAVPRRPMLAGIDDEDIIEIFDTNNKCVALVDKNGDTVWDETSGGSARDDNGYLTAQTIKKCPKCHAQVFENDFEDDGDCPWCGTPIFVKEGCRHYKCPSCQEENYLIESTFSSGDSECLRCGALFLDTVVGVDSIVGWNMDTATNHSQMIQAMMKEGNE